MILTEERWERYGIEVQRETVAAGNPDGSPKLNPDGSPEMLDRYVIVATDVQSNRRIRLALGDEARHRIAKDLTGGIVIPGGNGPSHLPFGRGV